MLIMVLEVLLVVMNCFSYASSSRATFVTKENTAGVADKMKSSNRD